MFSHFLIVVSFSAKLQYSVSVVFFVLFSFINCFSNILHDVMDLSIMFLCLAWFVQLAAFVVLGQQRDCNGSTRQSWGSSTTNNARTLGMISASSPAKTILVTQSTHIFSGKFDFSRKLGSGNKPVAIVSNGRMNGRGTTIMGMEMQGRLRKSHTLPGKSKGSVNDALNMALFKKLRKKKLLKKKKREKRMPSFSLTGNVQQPLSKVRESPSVPQPSLGLVKTTAPISFPSDIPASAYITIKPTKTQHSDVTMPAMSSTTTLTPTDTTINPSSSGDRTWDLTLDLRKVPIQYQHLFTAASRKWESVNVGDVPDAIISDQDRRSSSCPSLPDIVDDMFICAFVESMDGPGNVLGFGGPQVVRRDSYIPITGQMKFDVADIDDTIEPIILHEMGHSIGLVAAIWNLTGLLSSTTPPCIYAASTESAANKEYQVLSKCPSSTPIPIEQNFGPGTQCDHFDEDCFMGELMTGFSTGNMALSRITVGALDDLGYKVNYTAADPYSAADMGTGCLCGSQRDLRNSGSSSSTTTLRGLIKKKKLSERGRQNALSYGKAYLEVMKQKKESYQGEHVFVGDRFVSIVYAENGDVFTVPVGPH